MSWRAWVHSSPEPQPWFDFSLNASGSIDALAKDVSWKLPLRLMGPDAGLLTELATALAKDHNMGPAEYECWLTDERAENRKALALPEELSELIGT